MCGVSGKRAGDTHIQNGHINSLIEWRNDMEEDKNTKKQQGGFKKLNNMKIEKRLKTSFRIVTLIASVAAVIGAIAMVIMISRYSSALTNYGFSQGDIGKAMTAFADVRAATRGAISYTDKSMITDFQKIHDEKKAIVEEYMDIMTGTLTTDDERAAYNEIVVKMQEYWTLDDKVVKKGNSSDAEDIEEAQELEYKELAPLYDEVYEAMEGLLDVNVQIGNELSTTLLILGIVLIGAIILIIIVSILVSSKLGGVISGSIANPITALAARLELFEKGDLNSEFPVSDTTDEVSDMVQTAGRMAETLRALIQDMTEIMKKMSNGDFVIKSPIREKYVGDYEVLLLSMRDMRDRMNETLLQIDEASGQVYAGSGNLAQAAQALAEGSTDQAAAVEELQATFANITEGIQTTAQHVTESYDMAQKYADIADNSREEMHLMTKAMNGISETSLKIENIIAELEDIASQTNLLSLNASIEAARAGEAGRGFAVVADQIRKLAEQSSQSAVDTRELIENSIREVEEGNKVAENAAKSLEEVVDGIKDIAKYSKDLSEISDKQAQAVSQAESGMNQIAEVVQANSASAEETSATSEELAAQSSAMSELVGAFQLVR